MILPCNQKYIDGALNNDLALMQKGIDEGAWWHDTALNDAAVNNHVEACQFAIDHGATDVYNACLQAKMYNAIEAQEFLTNYINKTDPLYPNYPPYDPNSTISDNS